MGDGVGVDDVGLGEGVGVGWGGSMVGETVWIQLNTLQPLIYISPKFI